MEAKQRHEKEEAERLGLLEEKEVLRRAEEVAWGVSDESDPLEEQGPCYERDHSLRRCS